MPIIQNIDIFSIFGKIPYFSSTDSKINQSSSSRAPLPPTNSANSSIMSQGETTTGGYSRKVTSWMTSMVTCFVNGVLDGVKKLVFCLRSIAIKIGVVKSEEQTWEAKKKRMSASFLKAPHWARFKFLLHDLPLWKDPELKEFYIELFNRQDKAFLSILHHVASRCDFCGDIDFEVSPDALPLLILEVFQIPPSKRSFKERQIVSAFEGVLRTFPEYLFEYVRCCFESDSQSSAKFEALGALVSEGVGTESFHSKKINGIAVEKMIEKAFKTYYYELGVEEMKPLLSQCVDRRESIEIDDSLLFNHIDRQGCCHRAYEGCREIYLKRLDVIANSLDQPERKWNHQQLLESHPEAQIDLLLSFRSCKINFDNNKRGINNASATNRFDSKWQVLNVINPETYEIFFPSTLKSMLNTFFESPKYRDLYRKAAQAVYNKNQITAN